MNEEAIALGFEDAIWHCEHHTPDLGYVGKYALSGVTRELGFKVVITGEGADETFTGYQWFLPDVLREADLAWDSGLPENKRLSIISRTEAEMAEWYGLFGVDFEAPGMSEARRKLNGIMTIAMVTALIPSPVFGDWITNLQPLDPGNIVASDFSPAVVEKIQQTWHPTNTAQYIWTKGYLANVLLPSLGDRTEMAHAIEGRTPFLDHHVTEYANNIPPSLKVMWDGDEGFIAKYALREAMKPFVTQEVYERKKHVSQTPSHA